MANMPHDVFDHHHRAVHDHSEIQRPKREQIGRNPSQLEARRRKQERKRDGQRDNDRTAYVAEKKEENDNHQ